MNRLDRAVTRLAQANRLDVEERRRDQQKARGWGDADAGRGHVPVESGSFAPCEPNSYSPRG